VASSLKQQSEMFLAERADGTTELRIKVKVDVLGRLGSFGLSVMKTKADRMWDEFGQNLVRELGAEVEAPAAPAPAPAPAKVEAVVVEAPTLQPAAPGWLQRLLAGLSRRVAPANERSIRIEIQREGTTVTVHWPVEAANECAALLKDLLRA
jgi:hypothetical protein